MSIKLTDTQLIVLSKATASEDGAAILPERLTKAAAMKVGSSLVARKLMREIRSKPGMAIWREDENGRTLSLVMTRTGRDVIGVEADHEVPDQQKTGAAGSNARSRAPAKATESHGALKPSASQSSGKDAQQGSSLPREGSKQALIVTMMQKSKGASIEALIEATGWLPHTTRAALTGLRKRGFSIEYKKEAAGAVYRIVDAVKAAA
jgi:hypothetical protein